MSSDTQVNLASLNGTAILWSYHDIGKFKILEKGSNIFHFPVGSRNQRASEKQIEMKNQIRNI